MKYSKKEAKAYSRANMKGVWAAALTPFKENGAIDEDAFCSNMHHWVNDLGIEGLFIAGKQGEFFSMSVEERKRTFDLAVKATGDAGQTIMSCSDQNLDVVIDLAKHAQNCGADYIVVHAPMLHFVSDQDEIVYDYYKYICDQVDIGIAMWSHPDSGYLMSPELCNRIADLDNIVAIKYSVPREMYGELTRLAGDKILVSSASEEEWLDNIIELNWQLYLCSSPPYILQTKNDRRIHDYTQLAFAGKHEEARAVWESLQPLRHALKAARPGGKPQSYQKYWQDLIGQKGGFVRRPMLELTSAEKTALEKVLEESDLKL